MKLNYTKACNFDVYALACKQLNKYCIYLNCNPDWCEPSGEQENLLGQLRDILYLEFENASELYIDLVFSDMIAFDDKAQRDAVYKILNEDPFESSSIYACKIDPDKGIVDENT